MTKRRYDSEQTKKLIIEKTKILFSQKGYAATSIEDIVAFTGCSKGNLYYHFKNKEDLFLYLAEQTLKEWWDKWEEISVQHESVVDKLYAYADYSVDNFQKPLNNAGEEFLNRVGTESESGKKLLAISYNFLNGYKKLMEEGIARGEFNGKNALDMAVIFLSLHIGLSHSCNSMEFDKDAMRSLFHKATTFLMYGMCAPKKEI